MGTFYLSTFQSLFTFTWVKKFSQYFYFHQSIFKHEYLYFYLSKGCVYLCTYDGAGVDVIRVSLAVLHLQGDSGVIIWNTNGGHQEMLSSNRSQESKELPC